MLIAYILSSTVMKAVITLTANQQKTLQVFVNQTWVGGYYQLKATKDSGQLGQELVKGHGEFLLQIFRKTSITRKPISWNPV